MIKCITSLEATPVRDPGSQTSIYVLKRASGSRAPRPPAPLLRCPLSSADACRPTSQCETYTFAHCIVLRMSHCFQRVLITLVLFAKCSFHVPRACLPRSCCSQNSFYDSSCFADWPIQCRQKSDSLEIICVGLQVRL